MITLGKFVLSSLKVIYSFYSLYALKTALVDSWSLVVLPTQMAISSLLFRFWHDL